MDGQQAAAGGAGSPLGAEVDLEAVSMPRRRTWPWLVVGAGVGVAATLGIQQWTSSSDGDTADARTEVVELAAAEVTSRDLIGYVDYDGELARGASASVLSTSAGTVTAVAAVGSTVERGSVVASVDAEPVVAFYGSQPFYRDLESGDEGTDVLQLEANLWALGYTADGTLSVDGDYDSSTTQAVEAWEAALEREETGDFSSGSVVVIDGPSVISDIVDPGSSAAPGQQLFAAQTVESVVDVTLDATGLDEDVVIDGLVAVGTEVEQGTVLATLDGLNVSAVIDPSPVTTSILDAFADEDVERLENLLVFFGFDPDGALVVDDDADIATVAAVGRWQEAIGLAGTGEVGAPYYVVVPAGLQVVDVISTGGDPIGLGALAMTLGTASTSVTTDIVVDEIDDIAVGDAVEVVLADERILDGSVAEISDVAVDSGDGAVPTVPVEIVLDTVPDDVIVGPVTVRFETSRIADATVVPTRALVSLAEGGFAIEVRDASGSTRLIAVELGAFDDGVVEVVAGDVAPGDTVVVPT